MDTLKSAIEELYFWQYCEPRNNFYQNLIYLYRTADVINRNKLAMVYPYLAMAMALWQSAGDNGNDLFREWELLKNQ